MACTVRRAGGAASATEATLLSLPADVRGAEGVTKILIVALFAIPLLLLLVFWGGEVFAYLRDAWQGIEGQTIAANAGALFAPDDEEDGTAQPDDEYPDGGEPSDEEPDGEEDERERTVRILLDYIDLLYDYADSEEFARTGQVPLLQPWMDYIKANWSGDSTSIAGTDGETYLVPADTWGGPCYLYGNALLTQSELVARSHGADGDVSTSDDIVEIRVKPGPDGEYDTPDDLVWDSYATPRPEGW